MKDDLKSNLKDMTRLVNNDEKTVAHIYFGNFKPFGGSTDISQNQYNIIAEKLKSKNIGYSKKSLVSYIYNDINYYIETCNKNTNYEYSKYVSNDTKFGSDYVAKVVEKIPITFTQFPLVTNYHNVIKSAIYEYNYKSITILLSKNYCDDEHYFNCELVVNKLDNKTIEAIELIHKEFFGNHEQNSKNNTIN